MLARGVHLMLLDGTIVLVIIFYLTRAVLVWLFSPKNTLQDTVDRKQDSDTGQEQQKSCRCCPCGTCRCNNDIQAERVVVPRNLSNNNKTERGVIPRDMSDNNESKQPRDKSDNNEGDCESQKERKIKQLEEMIESKDEQILGLRLKTNELQQELAKAYAEEFTSSNEAYETAGDQHGRTVLAEKLYNVYKSEWHIAIKTCFFVDDSEETQKDGIIYLKEMLKDCSEFCERRAEQQMQNIFAALVDPSLVIQSTQTEDLVKSYSSLLRPLRQKCSSSSKTIESLQEDFTEKAKKHAGTLAMSKKYKHFNDPDSQAALSDYVKNIVECCWLMTICIPSLKLEFPDAAVPYEGKTKTHFKEVAMEIPLTEEEKMIVVWPAVLAQQDKLYKKGEAVINDT